MGVIPRAALEAWALSGGTGTVEAMGTMKPEPGVGACATCRHWQRHIPDEIFEGRAYCPEIDDWMGPDDACPSYHRRAERPEGVAR